MLLQYLEKIITTMEPQLKILFLHLYKNVILINLPYMFYLLD